MGGINWADRMARLPDEDLFEIVAAGNPGEFEQNVVDAATGELEKRSPDQNVVDRIEAQLEETRQFEASKATLPLSNAAWVAFSIFGIVIFWTLVAAYILNHRGYRRKAKQALWAIPLSLGLWWAAFLVLSYFFG